MIDKKSLKFQAALAAQQSTRERDYWLNTLADLPDKVSFPFDRKKGVNKRRIETINRIFPEEILLSFSRISKGVDHALHMVLTAALLVLLHKYTGSDDIVVGMPIYKQSAAVEFVNRVVALRIKITATMTFKEILLQVRQTITEAVEHQNYPIGILSEQVNRPMDDEGNDFPLFDVVILLQNIHDKTYIEDISTNMVWCFNLTKVDNCLEAAVEYNALFYKEDTILRVIDHWIFLVLQVLANNDLPISEVSLISGSEKKQLLEMANGPEEPLEMEQTIHGLFEVQAEKSGDGVAVVCMEQWAAHSVTGMGFVGAQGAVPLNGNVHLTYKELNKKSDQLAYLLREKGVQPDTIVGVMVEPCVEMVIAVLAILKTGGCYLPIDPEYPRERISYMLKDGNAKVLLAAPAAQVKVEVKAKAKEKPIELIDISEKFSSFPSTLTLSKVSSANLVYIMYTSGSTGRPKAVMVEHRSVVRLVKNANYIHFQEGDRILQTGSLSFDASTFEIWGALLNGLRLYLAKKEEILDPRRLKNAIKDWNITIIWMTSGLFNWMCQTDVEIFSGLKYLLVGGDVLSPVHINKVRKRYPGLVVINGYGPTENTTFSTTHRIDREYEENIPIGRPITNSSAYILDKNGYPVPIGVVGELVVGGEGVARGYMNRPELTAEKFILAHGSWLIADRREKKVSSSRELPMSYELSAMSCFYKTGDLARWLPEGAIEFLGRKDQQIKIRGQRIELGEIESQLLKHPDLTDAVVVTWTDDAGDLQLCAYVVYRKPTEFTGLREFLAKTLPDYMIPACFVALDKIPLTPNGKVDRKALPKPEVEGRSEYIAPRDEVEKKLVEIWREVLGLGDNTSIGIEDNFFDLGGHSLKATILAAKIHRELDIEIPLTEIFKSPTIRGLSKYIPGVAESKYIPLEPAEKREYYPLSSLQKRFYILNQMKGVGTSYNLANVMTVEGMLRRSCLEEAFQLLSHRHESLRTSFELREGEVVQRIRPAAAIDFSVEFQEKYESELFSEEEIQQIIKAFIKPFDLSQPPLLRVKLVKLSYQEHLLFFDMHHIISDGTSMGILVRDLVSFYQGKKISLLRLQYKDFCQWQNSCEGQALIKQQEDYWLDLFKGEIPQLALFTDYKRPAVQSFAGEAIYFSLEKEIKEKIDRLKRETGATLYMILLAVYNILLSKYSGQEDIVVGTPIAGRQHTDFEDIIGLFINALAMRNFPGAEKTFLQFLKEVRENTLQAFQNQQYPFGRLLEKLGQMKEVSRNPLFDVELVVQNMETPEVRLEGLRLAPYESYASQISQVDVALYAAEAEAGDTIHVNMLYCTALFKRETIERFIASFKEILSAVLENRNLRLKDIHIVHDFAEVKSNVYQGESMDFDF